MNEIKITDSEKPPNNAIARRMSGENETPNYQEQPARILNQIWTPQNIRVCSGLKIVKNHRNLMENSGFSAKIELETLFLLFYSIFAEKTDFSVKIQFL